MFQNLTEAPETQEIPFIVESFDTTWKGKAVIEKIQTFKSVIKCSEEDDALQGSNQYYN